MAWTVVETDQYGQLTEDQILGNAQMVDAFMRPRFWSVESIAAMCGNLAQESYINPGQWEGGQYENMSRGYGLGQWTPATKLRDFAEERGLTWRGNGNTQCIYIDAWEEQWHASTMENGTLQNPPITFDQFKQNATNLSVDRLCELWYFYWEEPTYEYPEYKSLPVRKAWAAKIYELIAGTNPPQPIPQSSFNLFYWACNIKRI